MDCCCLKSEQETKIKKLLCGKEMMCVCMMRTLLLVSGDSFLVCGEDGGEADGKSSAEDPTLSLL